MEDRELLRKMLRQNVEAGTLRDTLEEMGLAPTYENAIQFQMVKKAAGGDLSAAKFLRETLQEPEQPELAAADLRQMSTERLRQLLQESEAQEKSGKGLPAGSPF